MLLLAQGNLVISLLSLSVIFNWSSLDRLLGPDRKQIYFKDYFR